MCKSTPESGAVAVLSSVTGTTRGGQFTAALGILAEIGDLGRFECPRPAS